MSIKDELAEHLEKYPDCTAETCSHFKNYLAKVIFHQPDNGFICTVEAFDDEQAVRIIQENVARAYPKLDIKSIDVDSEILKDPEQLKFWKGQGRIS